MFMFGAETWEKISVETPDFVVCEMNHDGLYWVDFKIIDIDDKGNVKAKRYLCAQKYSVIS